MTDQQCRTCNWPIYPFCICNELNEARQAAIYECVAALQSLVERP